MYSSDMKVYRAHGALIIESVHFMKLIGFLSMGSYGYRRAKGAALFPFVFVRSREHATPLLINHERIHCRQQIETLYIGILLLRVFESCYARFVLRLHAPDSNLYLASEQEAYRHQHDMEYLTHRTWFSVFRYLRDKRALTFVEGRAPEVCVGKRLG